MDRSGLDLVFLKYDHYRKRNGLLLPTTYHNSDYWILTTGFWLLTSSSPILNFPTPQFSTSPLRHIQQPLVGKVIKGKSAQIIVGRPE